MRTNYSVAFTTTTILKYWFLQQEAYDRSNTIMLSSTTTIQVVAHRKLSRQERDENIATAESCLLGKVRFLRYFWRTCSEISLAERYWTTSHRCYVIHDPKSTSFPAIQCRHCVTCTKENSHALPRCYLFVHFLIRKLARAGFCRTIKSFSSSSPHLSNHIHRSSYYQ